MVLGRGTRFGLVLALAAAILSSAPAASAAPPGPPPSWVPAPNYAALGDSFAAGIGAPPYPDQVCGRSESAYGPLLAERLHHTRFSYAACSGARIADVETAQLGVLDRRTRLVTITVGGNDIGYSPGLAACMRGTDADCLAVTAGAEAAAAELGPRLEHLYATIRELAPRARLLVVGYPRLFELTPDCAGTPLSLVKRMALNDAADALNGALAAAARRSRASFVDVRAAFAGHGICGEDPWVHGLTQDRGAFHPNEEGQREGYYPAVEKALRHCGRQPGKHRVA